MTDDSGITKNECSTDGRFLNWTASGAVDRSGTESAVPKANAATRGEGTVVNSSTLAT